ncbi:MAG UNVERIFIED_CONTAM: hypothetical protein LVT10_17755 [Anaerolineae bacterium]
MSGMNLRSASGETNLTARKYHGGSSDDLQFVHETLHARYSNVPIALIWHLAGREHPA